MDQQVGFHGSLLGMLSTRLQDYPILEQGAAWLDISTQGRLCATGEDRVRLIHAIASNDIAGLGPGQGAATFFLNAQGRILAYSQILVAEDHVVLYCEPDLTNTLKAHIEKYIIMDDVSVEDVTDSTALIAIAGPQSADVLRSLCPDLPDQELSFTESNGIRIICTALSSPASYWAEVPFDDKQDFIEKLSSLGVIHSTQETFEAYRVHSGMPRFGVDYGPKNIPHETQQLNAVSFTKGCYTGQEIVERVNTQGKVQQMLVSVELESREVPQDMTIFHEGAPVGSLTSPTAGQTPECKARGFAIVRRSAAGSGTTVLVGDTKATILDISRS